MKSKKIAALLLTTALAVSTLAGCGDSASNGGGTANGDSAAVGNTGSDASGEAAYVQIDPNIEGELSIMVWSGDGEYYEDIGSKNWAPEDISAQNVASVYAMAKKFKEDLS